MWAKTLSERSMDKNEIIFTFSRDASYNGHSTYDANNIQRVSLSLSLSLAPLSFIFFHFNEAEGKVHTRRNA